MKIQIILLAVLVVTLGCKSQNLGTAMQPSTGHFTSINQVASATIQIVDQAGQPVSGATVAAVWSGVVAGTTTAVTDSAGNVTVKSPKSTQLGNYTVTISHVSKTGLTYDFSKNKISQATIVK